MIAIGTIIKYNEMVFKAISDRREIILSSGPYVYQTFLVLSPNREFDVKLISLNDLATNAFQILSKEEAAEIMLSNG